MIPPGDIPELPQVIQYPGTYTFRVIARHHPDVVERLRFIVQAVVGEAPIEAVTNRESAAGNYLSVHLSCLLVSEEQRRDVYFRLKADPLVKLTL
jgi:putative lipoic acid-binding regulatory protein